ncbi:MAG: hypothetical protein WKF43_05820 [Acidimicrobiales bacterium]
MRVSRSAVAALFYGGLAVLIAGVLFQVFAEVLPDSVATRIGHNSEAYVLALVIALWVQFARPRLAGTDREWPVVLAVSVGCVAIAAGLLATDFPSRFRTLNETFFAAAVLIPYLQRPRPLPRRLPLWLAAGVLAVIVVGNRTQVVIDLAETLGVLLLAPIGFDIVDRGILDPEADTSPTQRLGWYAVLIAAPIVFSVLQYGLDLEGTASEATRYAVRIAEAFLCMLAVELYFAVGLGRTGSGEPDRARTLVA